MPASKEIPYWLLANGSGVLAGLACYHLARLFGFEFNGRMVCVFIGFVVVGVALSVFIREKERAPDGGPWCGCGDDGSP